MQSLNGLAHSEFKLTCITHGYTLSELTKEGFQQRAKHNRFEGKSVAIQGNAAHLVRWMFFLDGFVENLILIPSDSCSLFISNILNDVGIDAVVIDESVDKSTWPSDVVLTLGNVLTGDALVPVQGNVNTHWLISTSGTTGIAKMVRHSLKSLYRTVARKPKHSSQVWGLLYDPTRFAGLQVTLQAMFSGATLVTSDSNVPLINRVEQMSTQGVTALSGTPTLWRRLLMIEQISSLKLRQITLGGEIADGRLLDSLASRFPKAHITHIFASTEAGVGFAVHDAKEGFPLDWLDKPIDGITLKISGYNTLMIQSLENVQTYANRSARIFDDNGWHDTGDLVEITGDRIIFKGRLNGSINVGGNKVMPEEVERHIDKLQFVAKSIVRARKSSIVGNLLEASIVLASTELDPKAVADKVRDHCTSNLAAYKVPAFIKIVNEIPMTASGKVKRGQ